MLLRSSHEDPKTINGVILLEKTHHKWKSAEVHAQNSSKICNSGCMMTVDVTNTQEIGPTKNKHKQIDDLIL